MMVRHGDMGPSCCLHQQLAAHQRGAGSAKTGSRFPPLHTSQVVQEISPSPSTPCSYSSSGAQAGPARHGHVQCLAAAPGHGLRRADKAVRRACLKP